MPRKTPTIQDKAVIAKVTIGNPVGEALRKIDPIPLGPMTTPEREDMVDRMENSIKDLMDEAESTYQANCKIPGTSNVDPDYITRLSTNEFFFYTKEPLTMKEFEDLQNKIAQKAEALAPGVQLILGSFAVKTDDKVMNVTPHITCGNPPDFNFIVKNKTSSIDVRYKVPGIGTMIDTLDTDQPSNPMPTITINGVSKALSFNNIVPCKTPGGTQFLTAVDVCLDHAYGVAKKNYEALVKSQPSTAFQPVSHVVVSNCIDLENNNCLGKAVMHVDPGSSPIACKISIPQIGGVDRKLAFGNDQFKIYEVNPEKVYHLKDHITNKYTYSNLPVKRDHKKYTVDVNTITTFKNTSSAEVIAFKDKYKSDKGDYLKNRILEDFKSQILETSSKEELTNLEKKLRDSPEFEVLQTGQGWFTQKTGIKTSSVEAFEDMLKQQGKNLDNADRMGIKL